jgi:hypothetical protein
MQNPTEQQNVIIYVTNNTGGPVTMTFDASVADIVGVTPTPNGNIDIFGMIYNAWAGTWFLLVQIHG